MCNGFEQIERQVTAQEQQQQQHKQQHTQAPVQQAQAEPAVVYAQGQQMAQEIVQQLGAGAPAAGPVAPPPAPPAQDMASKSKKEKKLLKKQQKEEKRRLEEEKRRQEEEARRLALEEQARREEEEWQRYLEDKRIQKELDAAEEKRFQQDYKQLMNQEQTLADLADLFKEKDQMTARQKAIAFLHTTAERLLEIDPEMQGKRREALRTEMLHPDQVQREIQNIRIFLAEQVGDEKRAQQMMDEAASLAQQFKDLEERRFLKDVINRDMGSIFEKEFSALPVMDFAMADYAEMFHGLEQTINERFLAFKQRISQIGRLEGQNGAPDSEESLFDEYQSRQDALLEAFDARVEQVMQENAQYEITREGAENLVLAERREALLKSAAERSRAAGIVSGVEAETWERYGGCSLHQTLLADEAASIVQQSKGFLYAVPAENGLAELRPTLPETIRIKVKGVEKEVPLRRSYNLMVKSLTALLIDENGRVNIDSEAEKISGGLEAYAPEFADAIRKGMGKLFADAKQAEKHVQEVLELTRAIQDGTGLFLLMSEMQRGYSNLVKLLQFTDDHYTSHLIRWKQEMEQQNMPREEIRQQLTQIPNDVLVKHQQRVEEALRQEGRPQEEIDAYRKTLASFYADIIPAVEEMQNIRKMDIDTLDVPLMNACSSNAMIIKAIGEMRGEKRLPVEYLLQEHLNEHLREDVDIMWARREEIQKDIVPQLGAIKEALDANPDYVPSEKEKQFLQQLVSALGKFAYHFAGNACETDDGKMVTVETFAAETTQAVVAPFTQHAAVGVYKGEKNVLSSRVIHHEGMIRYYNGDHALATGLEVFMSNIKEDFIGRALPGDDA